MEIVALSNVCRVSLDLGAGVKMFGFVRFGESSMREQLHCAVIRQPVYLLYF